MNADWKVIAATLGIFAVGLVAGVVTFKLGERSHRPPFPMMHEFGARSGMGMDRFGPGSRFGGEEHRWGGPEGERRDGPDGRPFVPTPEFEKQMRDYHEKLKAVLDPYQDKIKAVLSADQQKKLEEARQRHFAERDAQRGPGRPAGAEAGEEPEGGLRFIGMIIYKPVLERMGRDLQLDAKQQVQLDALFKDRRDALLKFLDANPPPTIRMALGNGAPNGAPAPASMSPPPVPTPAH